MCVCIISKRDEARTSEVDWWDRTRAEYITITITMRGSQPHGGSHILKTNTHKELEAERAQWNRCGRKARNARQDEEWRYMYRQPDKRRDGQPPGAEVWASLICAHPNLSLHRHQHATMG